MFNIDMKPVVQMITVVGAIVAVSTWYVTTIVHAEATERQDADKLIVVQYSAEDRRIEEKTLLLLKSMNDKCDSNTQHMTKAVTKVEQAVNRLFDKLASKADRN